MPGQLAKGAEAGASLNHDQLQALANYLKLDASLRLRCRRPSEKERQEEALHPSEGEPAVEAEPDGKQEPTLNSEQPATAEPALQTQPQPQLQPQSQSQPQPQSQSQSQPQSRPQPQPQPQPEPQQQPQPQPQPQQPEKQSENTGRAMDQQPTAVATTSQKRDLAAPADKETPRRAAAETGEAEAGSRPEWQQRVLGNN